MPGVNGCRIGPAWREWHASGSDRGERTELNRHGQMYQPGTATMTRSESPLPTTSRRSILKALFFALPAIALFKYVRPTEHDDIVEVDGWILKRSDLA